MSHERAAAAYREHLARLGPPSERELEGYRVWFDDALPATPRGPALDFGAGRGGGLLYLRERGWQELESFDVDPGLCALVEAHCPGARAHAGSDPQGFLREQAGRYDLILAKDVVEHLPKDETVATLELMLGALRPGGTLLVSVPHAVSFGGAYVRYGDFTHTTAFTVTSLRYVLEAAGAADVRFHDPRFRFRLSPKTVAYRALKRCWFAVLRGIYTLEVPGEGSPPHFHPRLVVSGRRAQA